MKIQLTVIVSKTLEMLEIRNTTMDPAQEIVGEAILNNSHILIPLAERQKTPLALNQTPTRGKTLQN